MLFTEVTVHTTTECSELVADVMWRYTNYGVALSDLKDVIALQRDKVMYWDYIDEELLSARRDVLVKAFIPLEDTKILLPQIRADLEELRKNSNGFVDTGTLETVCRSVDGDDWLEIWRKHGFLTSRRKARLSLNSIPIWLSARASTRRLLCA